MLGWLKKHELSIAVLSAVAALGAVVLAGIQISDARSASEAQVYLAMRDRYFQVWNALPTDYDSIEITRTHIAWPAFKRYWYVSFDEWYVTQRLDAFDDLWESYYQQAFVLALTKPSMRTALCLLKNVEFSEGVRREFVTALEAAHASETGGKKLCA
jgi:hypothetical protein